ncbi:MAG: type II secretion system F family protein [Planctomycetota bacterium]
MNVLALFPMLAQELVKPGELPPEEVLLYITSFFGCVVFSATGWSLFSQGWESYEEKYLEGAERTLDDLFLTIPPQQLWWLRIFFSMVGMVVGSVLLNNVPIAVVLGMGGFFSVSLTLRYMKKNRDNKFKEQLVEGLITLTNALRSGFSLPKAFQLIANDMPKPICQEFSILVQELRLGIDTEEGLRNMLKRMPSEDLDLVVTSVAISNSVGGNLAEVFDKIGETIRERRRIEGRIDALTAQGKMQGIVVSLLPIFVGLAINYIAPEIFEPMLTTWVGWGLLGVMAVMECLGYFFIQMICNIEV